MLDGVHARLSCCRCGVLPFVFDEDFGFARYVEYALDVPMYFVYRCATLLFADSVRVMHHLRAKSVSWALCCVAALQPCRRSVILCSCDAWQGPASAWDVDAEMHCP